jgi:hypothetical protein
MSEEQRRLLQHRLIGPRADGHKTMQGEDENEDKDGGENAVEDVFGHGGGKQKSVGEKSAGVCVAVIIPSAASGWGKRALGEKKNGALPKATSRLMGV